LRVKREPRPCRAFPVDVAKRDAVLSFAWALDLSAQFIVRAPQSAGARPSTDLHDPGISRTSCHARTGSRIWSSMLMSAPPVPAAIHQRARAERPASSASASKAFCDPHQSMHYQSPDSWASITQRLAACVPVHVSHSIAKHDPAIRTIYSPAQAVIYGFRLASRALRALPEIVAVR